LAATKVANKSDNVADAEPEHWGNRRNIWGATPRERLKTAAVLVVFFLGFILALIAIDRYRFLDDQGVWVLVALYAVAFPASFLAARKRIFPLGTPPPVRVMARAGWTLSFCAWCLGVVGVANGVGSDLRERSVVCVSKRMTRQRDPSRRTYYLKVRPWTTTSRTVEVEVPRGVYDTTSEGSSVHLTIGDGRFGLEWISSVN